MANTKIGYSLVDINSNTELQSWQGDPPPTWFAIPNTMISVQAPVVGSTYANCAFVERWQIDPNPGLLYQYSNTTYSFTGNTYNVVRNYVALANTALKNALVAYSANARFTKETGGITISNTAIMTDRQSQGMITGAYNLAGMNSSNTSWTINWKSANGNFSTMNAATITSIATQVGNYVQSCFNAEDSVANSIANGSITTLAAIDAVYANVATSF